MARDGRDVARSIQKRTGSLEAGVKQWCEDNRAARDYWESPNVHMMKYEDLISNFETTMTNLLSFLGEKYDCTLKDYYKRKKRWYSHKLSKPATLYGENHGHYRNWQINQPLFDGRGKYKELTAEELAFVNRIAGPMLVEFGYVKADDPKL